MKWFLLILIAHWSLRTAVRLVAIGVRPKDKAENMGVDIAVLVIFILGTAGFAYWAFRLLQEVPA